MYTDSFLRHSEKDGNLVHLSLVPEDNSGPAYGYTIYEADGVLKVTETSMIWKVGYYESCGMYDDCQKATLPAGRYRLRLYGGTADDPAAVTESKFVVTLINS